MENTINQLVAHLDKSFLSSSKVINWGSPVPFFGDLQKSKVITLGLNPSNREFVDEDGKELTGSHRRFHTLKSLGIKKWSEIGNEHIDLIRHSYVTYFSGNPYDLWFKKLDKILGFSGFSFYSGIKRACHLDLFPYATSVKWGSISNRERRMLLDVPLNTMGLLLRDSPAIVLILNGVSVIKEFETASGITLDAEEKKAWALPRKSGNNVPGYSFKGRLHQFGGVDLGRDIQVLGFNHNIQSSFGVTNRVMNSISTWVSETLGSNYAAS